MVKKVGADGSAALVTDDSQHALETVAFLENRIRELRQTRGLTHQQLSSRTGLSSSMLSVEKRGKTSPSIESLVAISSGAWDPRPSRSMSAVGG